ncbi:hypothetical protein [Natronospira bacteriovora]|uniref:Uncharacterized protein n=1 Tax=Natronospira bacteriovora TaxID=3069753 RepID=A0ABU0W5I1_9GAMM|nr:hypothetical protein [Natronospira sp. AB-CW4]MDQ2069282.1 hypothetical protein [Natronospira sp. AB-CW4]
MANQPDLFTPRQRPGQLTPAEIRRRLHEPLGDPALADKPRGYCRGYNQVRFRTQLQQGRPA